MEEAVLFAAKEFQIEGTCVSVEQIKTGHINRTYKVVFEKDNKETAYIFQAVNRFVFKNAEQVMDNIVAVNEHLKKKYCAADKCHYRRVLEFLKAKDGRYFSIQPDDSFWRCYEMITGSSTYNSVSDIQLLTNAASAFGSFCEMLSDFNMSSLHETIHNFHNTKWRMQNFVEAVKQNRSGRADKCREEIDFVMQRLEFGSILVDLQEKGELQTRVTHNDTKYNNVLLDTETGEPLAVIDLDTIMPGLAAYDFGDAIRYAGNTAKEDETDLSKVSLSLEYFEAFAKGFVTALKGALNQKELESLPIGSIMMTLECGSRFLADYIDGDCYFHCDYPEHNLDRARNQFALVRDMEIKLPQMNEIIEKFSKGPASSSEKVS